MDVDVVVLGTGLSESITAAALSKAGYTVAHIDANAYYGGDDASLSLDELVSWADERRDSSDDPSPYLASQRKRFSGISYSGTLPLQSRQYAISLQPTIIPAVGPLIDSLIASGVSRYGGFKLLERVAIYDSPGLVKPVPGSKEDVFKNKKLSLLHKRRLMRFLMFAGGEFEDKPELQGNEELPFAQFLETKFSLDPEAVQVIVYALAFCINPADSTLPALRRVRRYLRSTGRYGPSSFLVGHYGGLGEIAQGFCRTSAVGGAMYILGRRLLSIAPPTSLDGSSQKYTLQLEDLSEPLRCHVLVGSLDYSHGAGTTEPTADPTSQPENSYSFARCVAVIDRPIHFSAHSEATPEQISETSGAEPPAESTLPSTEIDTASLIFPPSSLAAGSTTTTVTVLITGEGSLSAPRGKWILYISMPHPHPQDDDQSAEQLLRPYLDATLTLISPQASEPPSSYEPLFTLFYTQHPNNVSPSTISNIPQLPIIHSDPYAPYLPEISDSAAINAEKTFWRVVDVLKGKGIHPGRSKDGQGESEDGQAAGTEIESFWPPLEYVEDSDDW